MKKRRKQYELTLTIDRLNKFGHGVADWNRDDAPPAQVEVPFALPGDTVRVTTFTRKRSVFTARLEEIITPSPNRIAPKCVHFGVCGGCRWQHLSYADQLAMKENYIRDCFASLPVQHPIVACDPPWHYRNKMEFSFSQNAAKQHFLGLIMDSSRGKVMNQQECWLTNPWMVQALQAARVWWNETGLQAYHPYSNAGSLRTLTLREGMRTGDRLVMLTVSGNPDFAMTQQQISLFEAYMRDAIEPLQGELSLFVRIHQIAKGQPTQFFEIHLCGPDVIREQLHIQTRPDLPAEMLEFTVSPSAFFQPNTQQAEKLYSLALQYAGIQPESVVYDLYCGTGTIGICAARYAKEVVGIELSPESSLDARTNAKHNNLSNYKVYTGDVGQVLEKIAVEKSHPHPDIVIVDPPRAGLDAKAIAHLIALEAKTIVYISCNPTTQAPNCAELVSHGYKLTFLQPVDQFPQTSHVENIALLERQA